MKTIGIILLIGGFLAAILAGFQISTRDLISIDPQQINNPDPLTLYWSPITAIVLLFAGAIVLFMAKKEDRRISHR